MIPLYALEASGGRIFSFDDPTVVKDGAALDGTGGTTYTPYFITSVVRGGADQGWNRIRRWLQRVDHAGTVTLTTGVLRDGGESAVTVARTLAIGQAGIVNVPLNETGSTFQVKVTVTAFSAPVAFSDAEAYILSHRRAR